MNSRRKHRQYELHLIFLEIKWAIQFEVFVVSVGVAGDINHQKWWILGALCNEILLHRKYLWLWFNAFESLVLEPHRLQSKLTQNRCHKCALGQFHSTCKFRPFNSHKSTIQVFTLKVSPLWKSIVCHRSRISGFYGEG